jgi:pyrroline-5-carboxylate reductase
MEDVKVSVVGLGIMGEVLVKMLIEAGLSQSNIAVKEKRSERLEEVKSKYKLISEDLVESRIIFLAVKPQDLVSSIESIRKEIQPGTLIVSIVAGVKCSRVESYMGHNSRVIRVMPNTPLLVQEGMSVIAHGSTSTLDDLVWVEKLFSQFGKTLVVEEVLMDAVTAVSGSGPAYFYEFVHCMIESATSLGLKRADAELLVKQTLFGASKMLSKSGKDAVALREEVTSPNGTTHAALQVFYRSDFKKIVIDAMTAANDRSKELSEE